MNSVALTETLSPFPRLIAEAKENQAMRAYEITDIAHPAYPDAHRIRATVPIPEHNVSVGQLGGYIQTEHNLDHTGTAWVAHHAVVLDNARVTGHALVQGYALVKENSLVSGHAIVSDNSTITGNSHIMDSALVLGDAHIANTVIAGNAVIGARATIYTNTDWATLPVTVSGHYLTATISREHTLYRGAYHDFPIVFLDEEEWGIDDLEAFVKAHDTARKLSMLDPHTPIEFPSAEHTQILHASDATNIRVLLDMVRGMEKTWVRNTPKPNIRVA